MNWETYKGMSFKQKDEYIFKFKDKKNYVNTNCLLLWLFLFISITTTSLFSIYLIVNNPELEYIKPQIKIIINGIANLFRIGLFTILLIAVIDILSIIYYYIKEYRWLKNQNIKIYKSFNFYNLLKRNK